jgi:septal ring factor EnvC (AmiA/AmiB activator)
VSKADLIKKITRERNKAVNQYSILQAKREQLHLLIKQLENLSFTRNTDLISQINQDLNNELDYLETTSHTIRNELSKAIKDKEEITYDLMYLQDKIDQLDRRCKPRD